MPELPELREMSNLINKVANGLLFSKIFKSEVSKNPSITAPFTPFTVEAQSRGKELCVILRTPTKTTDKKEGRRELSILCTMGMSGDWTWTPSDSIPKHAHLQFFSQDEKNVLSFVDPRRFGKWSLGTFSPTRSPDPTLEFDSFCNRIADSFNQKDFDKPICELLLNQKYFNGIGNYLRAEILDRLSIPPFVSGRSVLQDAVNQIIKDREQNKENVTMTTVQQTVTKKKTKSNTSKEVLKTVNTNKIKVETTVKVVKHQDATTSSVISFKEPNILTLCRDVCNEVIGMNAAYNPAKDKSQHQVFMDWLKAYSKLKSTRDANGRTVWYRNELGKAASPVKRKATIKKRSKKSKEESSDGEEDYQPPTPISKRRRSVKQE